jgi:hypothetical protein
MKLRYLIFAATLFFASTASPALSQSVPVKGTNLSGTITITGQYQQVAPAQNNRTSNSMSIFQGTCANADAVHPMTIPAGWTFYCGMNPLFVSKLTICISDTAWDAHFANFFTTLQ